MTPTITVSFPEGVALFQGTSKQGNSIWNWAKRLPTGKLVPARMPKSVVRRIHRRDPGAR